MSRFNRGSGPAVESESDTSVQVQGLGFSGFRFGV